jgi:hypothetical protein
MRSATVVRTTSRARRAHLAVHVGPLRDLGNDRVEGGRSDVRSARQQRRDVLQQRCGEAVELVRPDRAGEHRRHQCRVVAGRGEVDVLPLEERVDAKPVHRGTAVQQQRPDLGREQLDEVPSLVAVSQGAQRGRDR